MRASPSGWLRRLAALAIAVVAWSGLALQAEVIWARTSSFVDTAWLLLGYFTILTNLILALSFSALALRPGSVGPRALAGVTTSILLVGIVYSLLLRGLYELTGSAAVADTLLHVATPVLTTLFWLLLVRRGALHWYDPLIWACFPLAYLAYALVRGTAEGRFAYPFIDYVANGVPQVAGTILIMALAFLVAGWLIVWLDRRLAKGILSA